MRTTVLAVTIALAVAFAVAGCGGEEDKGATQFVPAAGENTPPDTTPGVKPGSSYDLNGNEWLKLGDNERFTAAQDYVADHPEECTTGAGTAAADPVRNWADASIGTDFPLNEPIAELLAEGYAAALQSGKQGLAPEQ